MRSGDWLTSGRARRLGIALFAVEALIFTMATLAAYDVFGPMPQPAHSDFVSFYAAGKLANDGMAALAYDPIVHHLTEQAVLGDQRAAYRHFFYPPVFLPFCQALARLPYLPALAAFVGLTWALQAAALRAILGPGRWALVALTFPPLFYCAGQGQNSLLTAALFGFATLLVDRRPVAAGMVWGLQSVKPHFLAMAPVALIAGRRWAALAGLAVSVAALVALTLVLYGAETWAAYLPVALHAPTAFSSGEVPAAGQVSVFGAARLLGAPVAVAYGTQAASLLVSGAVTAWIWRFSPSPALRGAALVAATALSVPVIAFYDLLPLGIAVAWLAREARTSGYRPWERTAFAAIWALAGLALPLANWGHAPVGPLPAALLLGLTARRAWGHAGIK